MHNSNSKNKPSIRFAGFHEEWEEKELGDATKIIMGQSPLGENYTNNPNDFILVQGNADMKNGFVVPRVWTKQVTKLANRGDIIISVRAPVGDVGKTDYDIVIGRGVAAIKGNEFIYQSLLRLNEFNYWKQYSSGSTFESINSDVLIEAKVSIPSPPEQSKIGSFFQKVDELISLRQKKLDKLKNLKKAMLEKMFPKEGSDVPEIRFAGFTEKWERKEYITLFTNISNNTLSRAELNYKEGSTKNVHYGDVLIKFGEILDIKESELPFITDEKIASKLKSSILQDGDVVIADAAEDETVGKCTELINIRNEIVVSGLHTIPIRPMVSFASGYLGYFMNSSAYHNQLLRLMQGTKVLSISKSALKDTIIIYPNNKTEQSKIGNFFQKLDRLIGLQAKEIEKLKNLKKAFLDKMFV